LKQAVLGVSYDGQSDRSAMTRESVGYLQRSILVSLSYSPHGVHFYACMPATTAVTTQHNAWDDDWQCVHTSSQAFCD
jgi:hypothetical protein